MKQDSLSQYVSLRRALSAEKTHLEARLASINQALNGSAKIKVAAATAAPAAQASTRPKFSAAARAKIAAAQRARWAKIRAAKAK